MLAHDHSPDPPLECPAHPHKHKSPPKPPWKRDRAHVCCPDSLDIHRQCPIKAHCSIFTVVFVLSDPWSRSQNFCWCCLRCIEIAIKSPLNLKLWFLIYRMQLIMAIPHGCKIDGQSLWLEYGGTIAFPFTPP
jgi:hypothetical protein